MRKMNSNQLLNEFRAKFRLDEYTIYKNDSWTWSLRPAQPTLGSGILSLNRYALCLSDVTEKEMIDLRLIIQVIEETTQKVFDYDIMNYLMLMMVDRHVHYHVIPRYAEKKIFADLEWQDKGWPGIPLIAENQHNNHPDIHQNLVQLLKENRIS